MKLPKVIKEMIDAQNKYDSIAHAGCFSETAVVEDEGNEYLGRSEIRSWIEKCNEHLRPFLKPLEYNENGTQNILSAEVSGNFDGSPLVMKFHHIIENGLIQHLSITT